MDEYQAALAEEFDLPPSEETPESPASQADDDKEVEQPADTEGQVASDEEQPAEDKPVDEEKAPEDEPAVTSDDDEEPKFATKDDVKAAMREYNQETSQRVELIHKAREEVIEALHPEGIDKNIYDTNGNVIKTAQDIVDRGLLNPNTNEPFSYEEAASWMMGAQQKMNQNIEELQSWAEDVAEKNVSLFEGNQRVMDQYGDVLKAMPNLAEELAAKYVKTLEFDKTGTYVTKVPLDPVEFYETAITPYIKLGEQMARAQELEAKQAEREAQDVQNDRLDLPTRGQSKTKSNTGDEMLDALMDELNS